MRTLENILNGSKYDSKIMVDSEYYTNIAYQIENGAIGVLQSDGRGVNVVYGSINGMEQMARELLQVIEVFKEGRI